MNKTKKGIYPLCQECKKECKQVNIISLTCPFWESIDEVGRAIPNTIKISTDFVPRSRRFTGTVTNRRSNKKK